jgi:DnaJ-class molecular chaperone
MKIKDYYKILGLQKTASANDIKKAYHTLIKKYHPDLNPGNDKALESYLEINEAYSILGDLDNRLRYSILLNQDLLDKELLHKHFIFPGMMDKIFKKTKN